MIDTKEYDNDYELLYMLSENNEDAVDLLYKKYKPVIENFVRKYINLVDGKGLDRNDLYQEGLIGLDSAIKGFSDQKNIKFSTFAFMCIERSIITAVRKANRQKHKILNESYSIDYKMEDDIPYLQNVLSSNNTVEELIQNKELEKEITEFVQKRLSVQEKEIYDLKMLGFDNHMIAKKLGKTYKSITCSISRIKIKLKNIIEKFD